MSSSFFPLSIHSLFAASSSSFDTCCDDCPPIVATDPPDPPGLCCWAFSTLFTASLFPLPVPDPCITVDPSIDAAECGGFGVVVGFSAGTTIVTVAGPFAVDTAGVGLDDDGPDGFDGVDGVDGVDSVDGVYSVDGVDSVVDDDPVDPADGVDPAADATSIHSPEPIGIAPLSSLRPSTPFTLESK